MDYDKANSELDITLNKLENKTVTIFNSNLNFIRNLRRYITNEKEHFETIVLVKAMKLTIILILVEGLLMFFGKNSILGLYPKLITLLLLYVYYAKVNQRGGRQK